MRALFLISTLCAIAVSLAACGGSTAVAIDGGDDGDDGGVDAPPNPDLDGGVDAQADAGAVDVVCAPCPECPWEIETVDISSGEFGSLALAPDRTLHVTYEEVATGRLKHAARALGGGPWSTEVVDQIGSRYSSLVVQDDGTLHVAYQWTMPGRLRYGRRGPGDEFWNLETVVAGGETGRFPSIGVATDGTVHITYVDETNTTLEHAARPDGVTIWSTETMASTGSVAYFPSLLVRSDGTVDIFYSYPFNGQVLHAEGNTGAWTSEIVEPAAVVGPYIRAAFGPDEALYVAYVDTTFIEGEAFLARKPVGGTWSILNVVDCCNSGYHPGLAVDPSGGMHVSYYKAGIEDLRYSYAPATTDVFAPILIDGDGHVGEHTSLVYAPDHSLHVTYFDTTASSLEHAERPGRCQ